jgi:hypothetical protein
MEIVLSSALLVAAACGSEGTQEPSQPVTPVPPAYSPPANPQAPRGNPQAPRTDGTDPATNPSQPRPNPQQPAPTPPSGATLPPSGVVPPQLVSECFSMCAALAGICVQDCNAACNAISNVSARCVDNVTAFLVCTAQQGLDCDSESGELDPPRQCTGLLGDACRDELAPGED